MKKIPLSRGKFALVDDDDFHLLNRWKWQALKDGKTFYAARKETVGPRTRKIVLMHRVIMKTPSNKIVDHKNWNGLDNRKSNLRNVSFSENRFNLSSPYKNNKSGYTGVYYLKRNKCWVTQVGKRYIGSFPSKKNAVIARREFLHAMKNKYVRQRDERSPLRSREQRTL